MILYICTNKLNGKPYIGQIRDSLSAKKPITKENIMEKINWINPLL